MSKVYLYCDESGAKGYADLPESRPGEVGVFAGILVPDSHLQSVAAAFDAIAAKYAPATGKLHIADLQPQQQGALRDELFGQIRADNLPCFWYAIHVEGLHRAHKTGQARLAAAQEAARQARGGAEPRIKTGSPRQEPESLHVQLFSGLYAHMLAFLFERQQANVEVEVRTDQVDSPIVKKFQIVAAELLDEDPHVERLKGFDTVAHKVVEREFEIRVELPPELKLGATVSSLAINTAPAGNGLVLAADVLSNSLNYLFLNRGPSELYKPLNCPEAVANHPLAESLNAFRDWGSGDLIGDVLYKHPLAN